MNLPQAKLHVRGLSGVDPGQETRRPVADGYLGEPHIGRNFNCYVGSGDNWSDPEGGRPPWYPRWEYCAVADDGKVLGCDITDNVGNSPQGCILSPALVMGKDSWILTYRCRRLSGTPYPSGATLHFALVFQDGVNLVYYESPAINISGTYLTAVMTTYTTTIDTSGPGLPTTAPADEANLLKIGLTPNNYQGYFLFDYIAVIPAGGLPVEAAIFQAGG
jgi:hypothetical protein